MKKFSILLFALIVISGFSYSQNNDVVLRQEDYNNWGWNCLVIENGYIEMVIVPELGGRILKYNFPGDDYMAINEKNIGKNYDPATDNNGPWGNGWGYGGYKNWPAPQSYWNWPPPPYLAWGPYSFNIEHQSPDSVIIYLESEVEKKLTPGLKQARRIKVYKNSSLVTIEQYLTNVSGAVKKYSIWDITQTIVQHDSDKDMANFSVYFPADESNIRLDNSSKAFDITEVATNVHKFQDTKSGNKAFMNVSDGWCAYTDERDAQSYFKLFEIDATASYPDKNANLEIYSGGTREYIEVEVLGPLVNLPVGTTIRFDENWSAAKIAGPILSANNAGTVLSFLEVDKTNGKLTGEFGAFHKGKLVVKCFEQGKTSSLDPITVDACEKVTLNQQLANVSAITGIELEMYDTNNKLIGVVDSWGNTQVGTDQVAGNLGIRIYPNMLKSGENITIDLQNKTDRLTSTRLISASGRILKLAPNVTRNTQIMKIEIPQVPSGIYLIEVMTTSGKMSQKLMIK